MIDWRFLGGLTGLLAVVAALAWSLVDGLAGGPAGLAAGLGFSFVSLALGFHWVRWGATRGARPFFGAALGGFLARMVAVAAFAVALVRATDVNLTVALLAVVATHVVAGMAEIAYLHRTDALR